MLLENVRRNSIVDVSYDTEGIPCLVEVYQTGRVRLLERATADAQTNGPDLALAHYLHQGAAIPSYVRRVWQ